MTQIVNNWNNVRIPGGKIGIVEMGAIAWLLRQRIFDDSNMNQVKENNMFMYFEDAKK